MALSGQREIADPGQGIDAGKFSDQSLNYYPDQEPGIGRELRRLDREWDVERALELLNPVALIGLSAGVLLLIKRKFGLGTAVLSAVLLQTALRGWPPPSSILRRLGVRGRDEIELEQYAMKVQRGDYGKLEVIPFK